MEGGEVERWTVTFTKHVKQKRKVYHDGYLLVSNNKVMLCDEFEQLLDSRFLANGEAVKSGESLAFASFLVDIGDPDTTSEPVEVRKVKSEFPDKNDKENALPKERKLGSSSFVSKGKQNSMRKRKIALSLSPSQKVIREFKKNELLKLQQSPPSATPTTSSTKEWEALYTTQLTQKAKKYHDGFICMVTSGSQGRQVILYDSDKYQLDKRFLKKDEVISAGESLTFDAYLVDIGDPTGTKGDDTDVKLPGRINIKREAEMVTARQLHSSFIGLQRNKVSEQQDHQQANHSVVIDNLMTSSQRSKVFEKKDYLKQGSLVVRGQLQRGVASEKCSSSRVPSCGGDEKQVEKRLTSLGHVRDAHQILSILKKPVDLDNIPSPGVAPVNPELPPSSQLPQSDETWKAFEASHSVDPQPANMIREEQRDQGISEGFTDKNSSMQPSTVLQEMEPVLEQIAAFPELPRTKCCTDDLYGGFDGPSFDLGF